jgi:hypothetical protein
MGQMLIASVLIQLHFFINELITRMGLVMKFQFLVFVKDGGAGHQEVRPPVMANLMVGLRIFIHIKRQIVKLENLYNYLVIIFGFYISV